MKYSQEEVSLKLLEIGMDGWAERVGACGLIRLNFVLMCGCRAFRPKFSCNHGKLCLGCGERKSSKVSRGLAEKLKPFHTWNMRRLIDGRWVGLSLLTFTIENALSYEIASKNLREYLGRWRHTQFGQKVLGAIWSLEVTPGDIPGCSHVHLHLLVYSEWIDNKEKVHPIPGKSFMLTDLAYSWFLASRGKGYIVDVRRVTDRKKAIKYVLDYAFKGDLSMDLDFRVRAAKSAKGKRSYSKFGSFYHLNCDKFKSICVDCEEGFERISIEYYEWLSKTIIYEKGEPPPGCGIGLNKWRVREYE